LNWLTIVISASVLYVIYYKPLDWNDSFLKPRVSLKTAVKYPHF